jgi:RNA polymerase sporulation-specific sigma factor
VPRLDNDDELIYMIHQGSGIARSLLYAKYYPIISYWVRKIVFNPNYFKVDDSDLINNSIILFSNAINAYRPENGYFYSYINIVVLTETKNYMRKFLIKQNDIVEVSYDHQGYLDNEYSLDNLIPSNEFYSSPSDFYVLKEGIEKLASTPNLTPLEKRIFMLKNDGYSYLEIAQMHSLEIKDIDNIIQKVRREIKVIKNLIFSNK